MWIVKPLVVMAAVWLLYDVMQGIASGQGLSGAISNAATDAGEDLQCAEGEFSGVWNGVPTCLHHGTVLGPYDGGPLGPVTSPDGT